MKITSTKEFHWVHDGKQEYDFGKKPVEISKEAVEHLVSIFGGDMFSVVEMDPEDEQPKNSEETKKSKNK